MPISQKPVLLFVSLILLVGGSVAAVFLLWPTPTGQPVPGRAGSTVLTDTPTAIPAYPPAKYVGRASCTECHQTEHDLWAGSHHDLAMQHANEDTVLGDFNDAVFTKYGVTSRFYKQDGKFFVHTEGPDGAMHDYEIAYTFGVEPLQQYLIAFPGGRYQALSLCWDTRPKAEGGQRWYHLYSDEPIRHDDPLHWTGPNHNWNFMCAECHSTDLKKNYDLPTNSYNTTWKEINVSCEACHGPASNHVNWARRPNQSAAKNDTNKGFLFALNPDDGGQWMFTEEANTAQRTQPRTDQTMLQTCARCHARRSVVAEEYRFGQDFLDTHRPQLLTENIYHPDGQILDEVYVYGSFIQSKMYHQGVTCTDCHDPHSNRVYAQNNSLCATCHKPEVFDTPKHHFHETRASSSPGSPGSPGTNCVDCHMPSQTYMGVDGRRDHSFRIPRPDLSIKLGTPNACNDCHTDQSNEWAQQAVLQWYGPTRSEQPHYGQALHAAHTQQPNADTPLAELAADPQAPGIARASALTLLRNYPSRVSFQAVQQQLADDDALIRFAALGALEMAGPEMRLPLAYGLLDDPVLTVRLEAARVLAAVDADALSDEQRDKINAGIEAYLESQRVDADRAESHLNTALIHTQRGQPELAEQSYQTAIRVNPSFAQAYVNLADLYRSTGRDNESLQLLKDAVDRGVNQGVIHYALGLARVRQGNAPQAIESFKQAVKVQPEDAQFGYTLGIALNSTGQPAEALIVLADNHRRHPNDQPTLYALMTISRDLGRPQDAIHFAETLLQLNPDNAAAIRAFIQQTRQSINASP